MRARKRRAGEDADDAGVGAPDGWDAGACAEGGEGLRRRAGGAGSAVA
ncbi:hypothetical protein AB0D86_01380 [Streptomyces sp. NPDC048324]